MLLKSFAAHVVRTMKNLFLITDSFPFGVGEKSFIMPEIGPLSKKHNITVLSTASKKIHDEHLDHATFPDGVKVIWLNPRKPVSLLMGTAKALISKEAHDEFRAIFKSPASLPLKLKRVIFATYYFASSWSLQKQLDKYGVFSDADNSIFYTFWFNQSSLALSLKRKKIPNLKLISRIHGYDLYNERAWFGRQPFQKFKDEHFNLIIFACDYAREYFETAFESKDLITKDNHTVIRLGSYPPSKIPEKHSTDTFTIVSCSNIIPLKRVHLIAEAIAFLGDSSIKWIHFGDGIELEKIKSFALSSGINAEFKGHVSNEKVKRFYEDNYVDAFITTSSTEGGCPVSISEALAFGIPIIGTNVGGIPEQIDGNGVLLSKNPTVIEIANSITALKELDEDKLRIIRNNSINLFYEKFNLDNNISFLLRAMNEVENKAKS